MFGYRSSDDTSRWATDEKLRQKNGNERDAAQVQLLLLCGGAFLRWSA